MYNKGNRKNKEIVLKRQKNETDIRFIGMNILSQTNLTNEGTQNTNIIY